MFMFESLFELDGYSQSFPSQQVFSYERIQTRGNNSTATETGVYKLRYFFCIFLKSVNLK